MLFLLLGAVTAAVADPLGPGAGPWALDNPELHGLNATALETMGVLAAPGT